MPLVLHGGTGIPEDQVKKAISLGVSKVNVNTECQQYFTEATRKYFEAKKDLEKKLEKKHAAAKKNIYPIGAHCCVMKPVKKESSTAASLSKVRYCMKYFSTHPPMTQ